MNVRDCLACILILLAVGLAQADEFVATLVKVDAGQVTFARGIGKKKSESTLPADEKCRVFVGKYDKKAKKIDAGDEVADGLKNPLFTKLEPETIDAWIRISADNKIVEMRIYQNGAKKKTKGS